MPFPRSLWSSVTAGGQDVRGKLAGKYTIGLPGVWDESSVPVIDSHISLLYPASIPVGLSHSALALPDRPGARTIEVMFLAVKRSRDALFALGFFVLMALIVFSTLMYFAERGTWDTTLETFVNSDGDPTQFDSILLLTQSRSLFLPLRAITTVGYGDLIPRSFLGRLLSVPLLLFGLLLIALPSFVLGREFASVWEHMGGNVLRGDDEAVAEARRHLNDSPMITRARPFTRARSDSYVRIDDEGGPAISDRGVGTRDLSNLKLAENQQALSRQIDQLAEVIRAQSEELKAVRSLLLRKGAPNLDD
ncbi:hypothetical protein FRC10_003712 [Ceratobasidium sp. 414]|nr:hypothetical protein FRC10_003712 [Ceratobasidium sp. 414]